ncbi:MAG: hypothetical protein ACXV3D_00380 [Halobacteriota archaeon]
MNWQPPVVVDTIVGKHRLPSLALDAADTPYITFCVDNAQVPGIPTGPMDVLSIAFPVGSTWYSKLVDASAVGSTPWVKPPSFNYPSLAIDCCGSVHVSYVRKHQDDPTRAELVYTTATVDEVQLPAPFEHTQVADNNPTCCALTLDQSGRPYIAWRTKDGALYCAHKDADVWETSMVHDATNLDAGKINVVIDESNAMQIRTVHIGYCNKADGSIGYSYSMDQGYRWATEVVKSGNNSGQRGTSIACIGGIPSVVYGCDQPTGILECSTRDAGTNAWVQQEAGVGPASQYPSLSLTTDQSLVVTYISMNGVNYACLEDGNWKYELVDSDASSWSSLAVSSSNVPFVTYASAGCDSIKLTRAIP